VVQAWWSPGPARLKKAVFFRGGLKVFGELGDFVLKISKFSFCKTVLILDLATYLVHGDHLARQARYFRDIGRKMIET
jgi:hypothetical protein